MLKKWPETEMEYWENIEALGGFIWHTNHDLIHGRYESSPEIEESLKSARETSEKLVAELEEKFGVIPPGKIPQRKFGQDRPPAPPKGKTYYWDWYHKMKEKRYQEKYDGMICSRCPYSEGLVRLMIGVVPCGLFKGTMSRLPAPNKCGMLHWNDIGKEGLYSKMLAEHGAEALEKFIKALSPE